MRAHPTCLLDATGSTGVVHGPAYCTPTRDLHETSTRYYSTNMDAIEAALEDLKLLDTKNISTVAKLHKVQRSTLSRRWRGVTNPAKIKHQNQLLLTVQQEKDLVQYINKLTEKGIPPTPAIVRNFVRDIAGKRPRRDWS